MTFISNNILVEGGLTATTISATTFLNAPLSVLNNRRLLNDSSSGLLSGGSITSASTTTFNISGGNGIVVNNTTDPNSPTITEVSWSGFTNQAVLNINTQQVSNIYITTAGTLSQSNSEVSSADIRDKIHLGAVISVSSAITSVYPSVTHLINPVSQLNDLATAIGLFSVTGNRISKITGSLSLAKSLGTSFDLGGNYQVDRTSPNIISTPALSASSLQYVTQTTFLSASTVIDSLNYDNGGVVTALPTNKYTAHRIWLKPDTNRLFFQYGQFVYDTLSDAKDGFGNENYISPPHLNTFGYLLAVIITRRNVLNLDNTNSSEIIPQNRFAGSGGGGTATPSFQDVYDASPTTQIITDATRGSLLIQNGAGVDNVSRLYEGANSAGTITSFIRADGAISATTYLGLPSSTFSGGTVTGPTIFTAGLSASSITATSMTARSTVKIGTAVINEDLAYMANSALSTGLFLFTNSGITSTASTTFNVGRVHGWIVNSDDPLNITPTFVFYAGASGLTTPYMNTSPASFLFINTASTLTITNTPPTVTQRRDNIYLGVLGHPSSGITGIHTSPDVVMNEMSQVRDMFSSFKLINDGISVSANSNNMTIKNTAGTLFGLGIGFAINGNDAPTVLYISSGAPTTFQYRTQTGTIFANTTTISATTYDLNGTATSLPSTGTTATNQRIYLIANGNIRIQFGQTPYFTLTEAVAAASNENYVVFSNTQNNGILIGILSVRVDCTDLTDTSKAKFLPINKLGETIGVGAGQTAGYLLATLNSSANADQTLTTTAARINFDTDETIAYGGIVRSGSTFVIYSTGLYQISFQPQVLQNVNNNQTTFWAAKNGVAIPRSGIRTNVAGGGDSFVLPLIITTPLVTNDVITFSGVTSAVNGSSLDFTASGATVPAIPAVIVNILGWKL